MTNTSIASSDSQSIPASVLWVMTIATGMIVGNLYYCQPLLSDMQTTLGGSEVLAGWIPTLTQLGYALGMLLLVPLGDRFERRGLIVISTFISGLAMIGLSQAPTLGFAIAMSLLVGVSTVAPQFIIPFAAHLAPEEKRGQVVGTVMSGLLLGILLARTVAGFIGSAYGWRSMFAIAALAMVILSVLLRFMLPKSEPTFRGSYLELLRSVFHFIRTEPVLRETMVFGSLMFAAFGAFWATLIHLMESEVFNLGARTVGIFGVFGALGALMAPVVGKLADRKSPRVISGYGIIVMAVSFIVYMLWGGHSLIALAIGVLLMDVGLQSTHISNQSRYFALQPAARSRINTAYMFAYFLGGAAGSYLGTIAWAYHGWTGVCAVSLAFVGLAGVAYLVGKRNPAS